jgi:SAM-dependent methyltransferase
MVETYRFHLKKPPVYFLELGAGPGEHARFMAEIGLTSHALDLAEDMVNYVLTEGKNHQKLSASVDNMCDFSLTKKFDIAALLMDSTSYLLTNQDVVNHLQCVAKHLMDGGLYILEMAHPANVFGTATTSGTDWDMERDGTKVHVKWGHKGDIFDPITQITQVSTKITVTENEVTTIYEDQAPQRSFTSQEMEALVELSGVFTIKERFGSLDREIPFDNSKSAWRMVLVLQKK